MALLVLILTGTVFAFKTDFESLRSPFYRTLENYDPDSNKGTDKALVEAWDEFQQDVRN